VRVSAKLLTMQTIPSQPGLPDNPDPVIPNPGQPQVGDPPGPQLPPQPAQPEITEPPAAPIEVPQPGPNRPDVAP